MKLMLAFIENKRVKITKIVSLSRSYGLSGLITLKALITLIKRGLVIPIFYFPDDVDQLLTRIPFASLFLSFDEVVDMKTIPKRLRDRLSLVINEFKRQYDAFAADIGIFYRPTRHGIVETRSVWTIIKKFYQDVDPCEIVDYLRGMFDTEIPNEDIRNYLQRIIGYGLLSLWTTYYLSIIHKRSDILEKSYIETIDRINNLVLDRPELQRQKYGASYMDNIIGRYINLLYFIYSSLKEAYFAGIELPRQSIMDLDNRITKGLEKLGRLVRAAPPDMDRLKNIRQEFMELMGLKKRI